MLSRRRQSGSAERLAEGVMVLMYDDADLVVRTVLEHTAPGWRG
jgi:hypothetical protein